MAFIGRKTYSITATVAATTAKELPELAVIRAQGLKPQIQIVAVTNPIVFKLGDGTVAASKTLTSNAMPDGNIEQEAGPHILHGVKDTDTHISLISQDGSSTPTVHIVVGYGEQV